MPRISDQLLDCVIYLYRTRHEAESGEGYGGSGFLVAVPAEQLGPNERFYYAVTNRHVVFQYASSVIRLNTHDGQKDILETDQESWISHPDGDDLAILNIGLNPALHKFRGIPPSMFVTSDTIKTEDIGPGDDTYMVGRFVSHEGKQRNQPSVRFGNIAMMPGEPLKHPLGHFQDSFVVEMRSVSGYSGSPVFLHVLPFASRPGVTGYSGGRGPWLLGVDWGHIFDKELVRNEVGDVVSNKWHVRANSGMIGVVPAWRLNEMIYSDKAVAQRRQYERQESERRKQESGSVAIDMVSSDSSPPANADNP